MLSHCNGEGLFHVDELTGAVTTTRGFRRTDAVYRLVISAHDHGQPARTTAIEVDVIVSDASFSHLVDSGSLLSDRMFVIVFGILCGLVTVSVLACVLCVFLVVRRTTKPAYIKPSSDVEDLNNTVACRQSTNDAASGQLIADWDNEYTRMIHVRATFTQRIRYGLVSCAIK